ncbi:protein arginine N-methyltransferase HSL7 [Polychaeton citri CBS 116435]|uniref:Protein arginine N-methyltransferase n=1 Tax=Polychaeton citri CBS 116435 TaxID=1314669 RepID=A0A9P4UPV1_9PEZI|nr:protein arginine N-methyltransferase HSL7 [Polychaeton citri CBS 116435]
MPDERAPMWYIGQHDSTRNDADTNSVSHQAHNAGYDLLTIPITTAHFHDRIINLVEQYENGTDSADRQVLPLVSPLMPVDTTLDPQDTSSALIATTASWIDLGSKDALVAHVSRHVFNLEVQYAAFCGVSNILIKGPIEGSDIVQYSRAILEALAMGAYLQLHIEVPMSGELEDTGESEYTHLAEFSTTPVSDAHVEEDAGGDDEYISWDKWDVVRTLSNYHPRLSVALELPRQVPSLSVQSRWFSEPLRILTFPRTSFLRNAKGYPVLSKAHQNLLTRYMRLRYAPWLLLSNVDDLSAATDASPSPEPTPAEAVSKARNSQKAKDPFPHLRYLRHLQSAQPSRPALERFGQGYQDYLQSPLQPLTDNLESITYEVFEKDPIKYEWYERAVALALQDLKPVIGNREAIIAVVGSGRGPLVARSLLASKQAGVPVKVWAVEKNLNAHVLLQRRAMRDNLWRGNVTVVKTDMRAWNGPVVEGAVRKVDIMVSELLGSFADNELSPECLDGVQHVLHPDHGINIPQSYTAHATPIATPKIYGDLFGRPGGLAADKWEIPYVVMLQQLDFLSLDSNISNAEVQLPNVQEAWAFSHPIPNTILSQAKARAGGSLERGGAGGAVGGDGHNEHNSRSCTMQFKCTRRGMCHGLAGYFESILYASRNSAKRVELSTNPVTMADKSKDMISWFPIFFPIKVPILVPDNADIEVKMWRQTDDRKVWYEWIIEASETTKGRKRRLGMSELHSSRKNGCIM